MLSQKYTVSTQCFSRPQSLMWYTKSFPKLCWFGRPIVSRGLFSQQLFSQVCFYYFGTTFDKFSCEVLATTIFFGKLRVGIILSRSNNHPNTIMNHPSTCPQTRLFFLISCIFDSCMRRVWWCLMTNQPYIGHLLWALLLLWWRLRRSLFVCSNYFSLFFLLLFFPLAFQKNVF